MPLLVQRIKQGIYFCSNDAFPDLLQLKYEKGYFKANEYLTDENDRRKGVIPNTRKVMKWLNPVRFFEGMELHSHLDVDDDEWVVKVYVTSDSFLAEYST